MLNKHKILTDSKIHLRQNYGDSIKDVILFGSQARGDSTKDSDYDILVILKKDYTHKDERKIINLCYDIDLKYDIIIDVHVLSSNELKSLRGKQPIFINALRTGIYA
ncbi:MAG: nucleotidyltransferase domain-containing protein [Bacteroidota bacterium]